MFSISIKSSKINLSGLGLKEIPKELEQCRNLRKLNLSNNQIKVIPPWFSKLRHIQNLDLGNNQITTLYAGNFLLPKLEVLILKNNLLKQTPHQVGNLDKLKKLNISGNMISALPNDITRLNELESLNLADNSFAEFPEQILKFLGLKTLWLNNNPLCELPLSAISEELKYLKALYCFSTLTGAKSSLNLNKLQAHKGNCISELNLLSIRSKSNIVSMSSPTKSTQSIFISYCHADAEWLNKIKVALDTMAYEGLELNSWDDTRLNAGDQWKQEIEKAISNADIAILLVSNNFLASKFIREKEVPPLLQKAKANGARILPVIVGLCRFKQSILSEFQAVNAPDKPLNALTTPEQEHIIYNLTLEIDKTLAL